LPAVFAIALGAICIVLSVTWLRGQDAPGVRVNLGGASVIHRTPVPLPEAVEKGAAEGTVQLEVTLDDSGNVADAHVLSGPQELRKTSLESVLNWHFTKDAAKGTRLISITYSNDAKQVQVSEPESRPAWKVESFHVMGPETTVSETYSFVRANGEHEPVVLTRRQDLERNIQDIRKQISAAESAGAPESAQAEMRKKMAELMRTLEATPFEGATGRLPFEEIKRTGVPIKTIIITGLPEAARSDLLASLPVRVGDRLSSQSLTETRRAVKEYDEHLGIGVAGTADGQVEVRIGLSEEGRAFTGVRR
jgi:hypothetical protein